MTILTTSEDACRADLRAFPLFLLAFLIDVDLHCGDGLWRNGHTELFWHVRTRTASSNVFQRLGMFLSAATSNNYNNNLRLMMVKTNRSTLHTVYSIQQSVMQGSNDTTHRLSRRTAATTRFEVIGNLKQTTPRFCQHPIRWACTLQAFTRWRHLSTHPINRPATHLSTPEGWKAELA